MMFREDWTSEVEQDWFEFFEITEAESVKLRRYCACGGVLRDGDCEVCSDCV